MNNMKRRICVLLAAIMMLGGMKVYAETPIDQKGNKITEDYEKVTKIEGQRRYIVSLKTNDTNKMTIIDENGCELLSERYVNIFEDNGYICLHKNNGQDYKIGYADKNSLETVIPVEFDGHVITENKFYIYKKADDTNYDYYIFDNNSLSFYKSLPYIASVYNYFDSYQIGLSRMANDRTFYGLADEELNVLIEPEYNETVLFGDKNTNTASDYAIVFIGESIDVRSEFKYGKYGVIDKTGNRVIPCEYDKITMYDADTFYCEKNGIKEYISVGKETSMRDDIPADNPSAWAQNEVSEAIGYGIVTEDFQCNYTEPITREDFCRLIVNTLRVQIEAIPNHTDIETISFTDTDVPDIKLASALGIVAGIGNNKFNPDGKITRQEAARMLYQAATVPERFPEAEKCFNYSFIDSNKKINVPNQFNDISKFEYWSSLGIQYCYQNEIMFGVGDNNFDPLGNYTREQAYLTALRLYKKINGENISSNTEYNYTTKKYIYGDKNEEFDKVYTTYDNKTVVFNNNKYSLADKNGNIIIDDIGNNIELLKKPDTYVYDCYGDWLIITEPLYGRTDGSIYDYRSSLYKVDGTYLWTMPNMHFTDSGDVVCVNETDESDGDNIKKAHYTLFEREEYSQNGYLTKHILVYKK